MAHLNTDELNDVKLEGDGEYKFDGFSQKFLLIKHACVRIESCAQKKTQNHMEAVRSDMKEETSSNKVCTMYCLYMIIHKNRLLSYYIFNYSSIFEE